MAKVKFANSKNTIFGELDKGNYFEYNGKLYVKCHRHLDEEFDYWVNKNGQEEMDYTYNAFSFANDEFVFFYEEVPVIRVWDNDITITVNEEGD